MYKIESDIRKATTLPPSFYQDAEAWEACKEKVFCQNWQYLGNGQELFKGLENVYPLWVLEKYLDEPVLLVKQEDKIKCLTNVCTHRGFLLAQHPAKMNRIVCQYHGRRFDLNGKFEAMPEFQAAEDFPRPCDHLHELPLRNWKQFLFTSLGDSPDLQPILERLDERVGFLPLESFTYAPTFNKTYNIQAHWALYCDNYLEGFHIPFVHMDLRSILDYGNYTTETYDRMVLQIGYSNGSDFTFDLPEGHPDYGKEVTAYYYWIYPNFMFNFYPWGVQVNVVKPISPNFTKVDFYYYVQHEDIFELMNGAMLAEKTEREDEFVVEAVQRGLKSRFYPGGRFSPKRENGVHHFHRLLAASLGG